MEHGLIKIAELLPPFGLLGVGVEHAGYQGFQLPVQLCFRVVPPAIIVKGVAQLPGFDDVVHIAVEFKFPGMLPTQCTACLLFAELQQHQRFFVHPGDHPVFHFFFDYRTPELQPAIGDQRRSSQTEQE